MNIYVSEAIAIAAGIEEPMNCEWCGGWCDMGDTVTVSDGETSMTMCDECHAGVCQCVQCRVWSHSDIEDITDENGLCGNCAAARRTCDHCGSTGDDVREEHLVGYDERPNGRSFRRATVRRLCPDCWDAAHPEEGFDIDDEAVAMADAVEGLTPDRAKELIENNRDTDGTAWKLLADPDGCDYVAVYRMMRGSRRRHEDTDYDELLARGITRETARDMTKAT